MHSLYHPVTHRQAHLFWACSTYYTHTHIHTLHTHTHTHTHTHREGVEPARGLLLLLLTESACACVCVCVCVCGCACHVTSAVFSLRPTIVLWTRVCIVNQQASGVSAYQLYRWHYASYKPVQGNCRGFFFCTEDRFFGGWRFWSRLGGYWSNHTE